jgi:hypothetical protein
VYRLLLNVLPLFRTRDLSPDITLVTGEGIKKYYVPLEHHIQITFKFEFTECFEYTEAVFSCFKIESADRLKFKDRCPVLFLISIRKRRVISLDLLFL